MRLPATAVALLVLCGAAVPASAQEGRDHTHNPNRSTASPRMLLRMLAPLQESHLAAEGRYARTAEELRIPSMDAIRLQLAANGSAGYTAVATSATEECVLFHGAVRSPRDFATRPDQITCRPIAAATDSPS